MPGSIAVQETRRGGLLAAACSLCGIFVVGHAALVLVVAPEFQRMFIAMGGELPVSTQLVINFYTFGPAAALLLLVVDASAFAAGYWVARSRGRLYLLVPTVVSLMITAALIVPLYLPRFDGAPVLIR